MRASDDFDHGHELSSAHLLERQITRRDLFRYGGMLGFGVVGAGMLASCAPIVDGTETLTSAAPAEIPPAAAKYVVIVIVDGCRADYVDPKLHLPTLEAMMRSGTTYSNAWSGSLQATTPACHACIGTGRYAKNNGGILGFYWENPNNHAYGECVNLANSITNGQPGWDAAVDPTSLEQIMQAAKIPTMASYIKDVDPTAKIYAGAGEKFYAADAAGGPDADFITYIWNYGGNYYHGLNVGGPNHQNLPQSMLDSIARDDYSDANYGKRDPKTGKLIQ